MRGRQPAEKGSGVIRVRVGLIHKNFGGVSSEVGGEFETPPSRGREPFVTNL